MNNAKSHAYMYGQQGKPRARDESKIYYVNVTYWREE